MNTTLILDLLLDDGLFRAAMEIINNAIKHSSATEIKANISNDSDFLYVVISDNGVGFNPEKAEREATKKRSFGLFNIRERISYLNGEMKIKSKKGFGTDIKIKIPY